MINSLANRIFDNLNEKKTGKRGNRQRKKGQTNEKNKKNGTKQRKKIEMSDYMKKVMNR